MSISFKYSKNPADIDVAEPRRHLEQLGVCTDVGDELEDVLLHALVVLKDTLLHRDIDERNRVVDGSSKGDRPCFQIRMGRHDRMQRIGEEKIFLAVPHTARFLRPLRCGIRRLPFVIHHGRSPPYAARTPDTSYTRPQAFPSAPPP